jgi:hypothetical protein
MLIDVSDVRSNPQDQIAHAARVIGRSEDCRKVFSAIYQGKKAVKTVTDIVQMTSLARIRVLQEARKLFNNRIVKQIKVGKDLAYEKDPFFTQHKKTILRLAGNKKALERFPTKITPKIGEIAVSVSLPKRMVDAQQITIDGIDSFNKVRGVTQILNPVPIDEEKFQQGLQKIMGETGNFQDWGGETDDLFSTRLVLNGERKSVAFGLKGKGTTGKLTPKKMGKRGDQVQRLFRAPAEVFLVQYWDQIDESIMEQMKQFAVAKSAVEAKRIYYGVIDGQDTLRILTAYPECFS